MIRCIAFHLLLLGVTAGQAVPPDEPGSVSGRVVNAATGEPVVGVEIVVYRSGVQPKATTDTEGRYTLDAIQPGRFRIAIGYSPKHPFSGTRMVTVSAGQDVQSVDFRVYPNQSIAGRVLDESNEPVPGLEVVLLGREYFQGELRYYRYAGGRTDDRGEYRIERGVAPGIGWLLWAAPSNRKMDPVSDAPDDPKLRRRVIVPIYYPGVPTAEEATVLTLRPGEQREGVDFRMVRSQSFCLESQVGVPGEPEDVEFWIEGAQPGYRMGAEGGMTGLPPGGKLGSAGKLRLCDLGPGDYRLTLTSGNLNSPDAIGTTLVSITDRDVQNVQVVAQPRLPLTARVVWAAEPPESPAQAEAVISLRSLQRSFGGLASARCSVPGACAIQMREFEGGLSDPVMDEYAVRILGRLPDGVYVKDISYGGTSVLHRPLRLGSAMAGSELRITMDHDGAVVKTRVSDGEGRPIGDATVILIPKEVTTHLALADTRIAEKTDQNGEYTRSGLAPGAYLALATEADFTDLSPETITALFNARGKAKEVQVAPGDTVDLSLEPLKLDR